MRTLTDHQVNPANDTLTITVLDEPGSGGASHRYEISGFIVDTNPSGRNPDDFTPQQDSRPAVILFQNGPIPENGVNGVTQEALLAIVADRLRCFQAGPYASDDNAMALQHVEQAMRWLHKRTLERMARGVEGTHTA